MTDGHPEPLTGGHRPTRADIGERLTAVLRSAGAHQAALWRRTPSDGLALADLTGGSSALIPRQVSLPLAADAPHTLAVRQRGPVTVATSEELLRRFPQSAVGRPTDGVLVCLPVRSPGPQTDVVGVLTLSFPRANPPDTVAVGRLQALADGLEDLLPPTPQPAAPEETSERWQLRELLAAAERAEADRDGLLGLMTALSPALTVQEVAAVVTTELPQFVDAYSANLALLDDDRTTLNFVNIGQGFTEAAVHDWRVMPLAADAPIAEAAREGRPVFNRTLAEFVHGRPHLVPSAESSGVQAWASLPLVAGGRPLGAIGLTWLTEQDFGDRQRALLLTVADACAQALERARLHGREHDVSVALQHALLPQRLPEVPGISLAARYLPAGEGVEVGGDWYDTWPTGNGRLAVALGDVMGRGPAAAAVMGQVRAATRAYVAQSDSPARLARSLDRLFADFEIADALVTLVYAVVDPQAHTLDVISMGHLPPLLAHRGQVETLAVEPGLPLGVEASPDRSSSRIPLPDGATLLLFSDGLVEHRRRSVGTGLAELTALVGHMSESDMEDVAAVGDTVTLEMLRWTPHEDDVALLILRLQPGARAERGRRHVDLVLPPRPASAGRARRFAVEAVRSWGLDDVENDVALVATELVSNAILHAASEIELSIRLLPGRLRLEVVDRSPGMPLIMAPTPGAHGGRGVFIVGELAKDWGVDRTEEGKRVWAELLL